MQKIIVSDKDAGQRLDKFLGKYMAKAPKSFFYKMLRKKNIKLNGSKADGSEKLAAEDEITLYLSDETIANFKEQFQMEQVDTKLDILYEDANILILNKEVGMLSQKAKKEDISIIEHLISYLVETKQLTQEELNRFRPGV